MKTALIAALVAAAALAGCNTSKHIEVIPENVVTSDARLACIASRLSATDRKINFTVGEFPDKTGKINTNGGPDATGAFNTQGADTMLRTTLGRTGVNVVDISDMYRKVYEWQKKAPVAQSSNTALPSLMISGAITSTDFNGGKGFNVEIAGVGGGVISNSVLQGIDMYVVTLPVGKNGPASGRQIAQVTVTTEVKQGGVELKVKAFDLISQLTKEYIALDAGYYWRAPLQYSTRNMIEYGLAELLAQIYKIQDCTPAGTSPTTMVAEAK